MQSFRLRTVLLFCFIFSQILQGQNTVDTLSMLQLDPVLISDHTVSSQTFKSIGTVFNQKLKSNQNGLEQISQISGFFVDNSLGEVYGRVYARGIAASAEDDIGWYYMSLQEDGLPISAINYNYFTPDFFYRSDLFTDRLEGITGGKAGILAPNAPGGIVNFISRKAVTPGSHTEIKMTAKVLGQGHLGSRADLYLADWIGAGWHYNFAGFYRKEQAHRDVPFDWNKGGQLRGRLTNIFANGSLKLHWKYLNDRVNRYTGNAAVNWDDPKPAFGQSFSDTAVLLPEIADGFVGIDQHAYEFNPANGIHVREASIGANLDLELLGFSIQYKSKYSNKNMDWQTSFSNNPLPLDGFLGYFVSGDDFPIGTVSFADARTSSSLATLDNTGIVNIFSGGAGSFEYLSGSLPDDALLGIAAWKKKDQLREWMQSLNLSTDVGKHHINFGAFSSWSKLDYFTNASFAYATYEAQPRLLQVELTDLFGNSRALSDNQGLSNIGGLFFEQGRIRQSVFAINGHDRFKLNDRWSFEFGARLEYINHTGQLNSGVPLNQNGGLDSDPSTGYDNNFLVASAEISEFDFGYTYLSSSAGFSYGFDATTNLFGRVSNSYKAPELNYYINSFSGLPIAESGAVQNIQQFEIGAKKRRNKYDVSATAFASVLKNVAISNFVFDTQTETIFYTPLQLNSMRTFGLELQWNYALSDQWQLSGSQTIQDARAINYTVYDANGTIDQSDDVLSDWSSCHLPHQAKLNSIFGLDYTSDKFKTGLTWRYMGARYGNIENSFELPAFSSFGLDLSYDISDALKISCNVQNVLNSTGLMNFFGPNQFGSNADAATETYIANNPDASFVVFPILPRTISFSVLYRKP